MGFLWVRYCVLILVLLIIYISSFQDCRYGMQTSLKISTFFFFWVSFCFFYLIIVLCLFWIPLPSITISLLAHSDGLFLFVSVLSFSKANISWLVDLHWWVSFGYGSVLLHQGPYLNCILTQQVCMKRIRPTHSRKHKMQNLIKRAIKINLHVRCSTHDFVAMAMSAMKRQKKREWDLLS